MELLINEDQRNKRLDVAVADEMPRLSRAFIQKLCDQGKITVNGATQKPGYKTKTGDKVSVDYDLAELDTIPHIDLPVIYEDDNVVVIDKLVGVLTHARDSYNTEPTVATFLRSKISSDSMSGERAGIVHRLDRATSGVIIGAKNSTTLSILQKQFSQRKTKKTYMAIVEGHLKEKEAVIDMPIERNPKAPATFRVGHNGKAAVTHYKVIAENAEYSLVELKPETGRTHQLRVHLSQIGHPIVGDPLYGSGTFGDRLYLHALSLEITLPGGERRTFEAPLPAEFEELMK